MIEQAATVAPPSYRNYDENSKAVSEFTPPVQADPETEAPKRVRLTTTRMRNLDSSLTAAVAGINRTYRHISDMLDGRDDDDSPTVLALRKLWDDISQGNLVEAQQTSGSIVATFNSFA
jgi:hypothetical protein